MIVQTSVCFHQLLGFVFKPRTVFEGILLPGEAVGYPSLKVSETQADKTMGNLLDLILLSAGGWIRDFQRFLPTSTSRG